MTASELLASRLDNFFVSIVNILIFSVVATTFGAKVFKDFAWIVPFGVACSTFGAANGLAFTSARLRFFN